MASPVTGASGNVEFLLHARKGGAGGGAGVGVGAVDAVEVASLVGGAVAEAEERLSAADSAG
jgi:hypothetical protein